MDEQLALIDAVNENTVSQTLSATQSGGISAANTKQDWISQKEQQAAQRKKENEIKKCEERIEQLEKRNEEIDALMASPDICTDVEKLQELSKERENNDKELNDLYEKWELLSE